MIAYKATDLNMTTRNGCKWELGKRQIIHHSGKELCSGDVFHFNDSPEIAVFANHKIDETSLRIFEIECEEVAHDGIRGGTKYAILTKELSATIISREMLIETAIRSAMLCYKDIEWDKWAKDWLSGKNRTASFAKKHISTHWHPEKAISIDRAASFAASAAAETSYERSASFAFAAVIASINGHKTINIFRIGFKQLINEICKKKGEINK